MAVERRARDIATAGWALAAVAVAAFVALDVFLLTTVVQQMIDLTARVSAVECSRR